jgi:hypothetical protein
MGEGQGAIIGQDWLDDATMVSMMARRCMQTYLNALLANVAGTSMTNASTEAVSSAW